MKLFKAILCAAAALGAVACSSGVDTSSAAIKPNGATNLKISGLAAATTAGAAMPFTVTATDAKGKVVDGYVGTVVITTDDTGAAVPAAYTFTGGDAGAHTFAVALVTAGSRTVTISDGKLSDRATVVVSQAAAARFVVDQLAPVAIAGSPVTFRITAQDRYGNLASSYSGPVGFTSTDPAATFGAAGAFAGGQASGSVAFGSIGAQTVTVSDTASAFSGTGGPVAVHGLVYTAPAASGRTLQVVADASSTAALVVLKVVAAAPASGYSAGFNIPADASRARVVDVAWTGGPLDPGTGPAAIAAALPGAGPLSNTLTSGISQKAAGGGAVATDSSIAVNNVLYAVRLAPTSASPGVVFDGSQRFRAALRDRAGNEVLSQSDFAIGKLEIR